jgi:hypothetical protein
VTRRRALICAILVYVALDLSLPSMPGAFVFAPEDSVESIQANRGRGSVDVVLLPAPIVNYWFVLTPPRAEVTDRPARTVEVAPSARSVVHRLPRATLELAPSVADPH